MQGKSQKDKSYLKHTTNFIQIILKIASMFTFLILK